MSGDRKRVILEMLRTRIGPERAITAAQIAESVYGSREHDRTVRQLIQELVVQDGHGEILANTGGDAFSGCPPGYFWASNDQQADDYYQVLVSRREEITRRMDAAWQARNRLRRQPVGQMGLAL